MCSATDLLQMSKAKLEDLFLLMVLSEGQSAKIWTNQNLRTEPKSPDRTKISKKHTWLWTLILDHSTGDTPPFVVHHACIYISVLTAEARKAWGRGPSRCRWPPWFYAVWVQRWRPERGRVTQGLEASSWPEASSVALSPPSAGWCPPAACTDKRTRGVGNGSYGKWCSRQ